MKRAGTNEREPKVRINAIITGEPALWIIEWKRRGLITSNSDAVIQALRALYDKISELDLRTVQLKNFRKVEEEFHSCSSG